ncbi:MAG: sulfite exporter TauE/SafE family protein [Clostridia bacterium]|nr:sulfite exporter TauE/SafE family protein [Clostridia bacterium]
MNRIKSGTLAVCLFGGLIGLVNGLFGGGGGMIAVPVLVKFLGKKTRVAHATAIAVIFPVTVISAAVYLFRGGLGAPVGIPVSMGVTAGGVAGALLLSKLKTEKIKWIFALAMLFAGIRMLFG